MPWIGEWMAWLINGWGPGWGLGGEGGGRAGGGEAAAGPARPPQPLITQVMPSVNPEILWIIDIIVNEQINAINYRLMPLINWLSF